MRQLLFAFAFVLGACSSDEGSTDSGGGGSSGTGGTSATGGAGSGTGGNAGGTSGTNTGGASGSGNAGLGGTGATSGTGGMGGAPPPADCPDVGLDAEVVYYVCDCESGADASCVAGDDSAPGTMAAPFRTYEKARATFGATLNAGETIAFCRGGSFTTGSNTEWTNTRCTASSPCVVRDYLPPGGADDLPIPVITASDYGVSFANGGNAEHEEGYVFMNLDMRSTSGMSNAFFFFNDIDDVTLCGVAIDGFEVGINIQGSNPVGPGSDGKNARIVVNKARITNNGGQGYLGGCDDCGVSNSYFDNNGFAAAIGEANRNHNVYFASHTLVTGMFAIGNELHRSAVVDGQCQGVSLVVHGQFDALTIEGNRVEEELDGASGGCWGIAVDTGYGNEAEQFKNVVIRGNQVVNVGNLGIGASGCDGCLIENNIVVQEQTAFGSTLIAVPNRQRDTIDLASNAVTIRNNTLFADTSQSVTGIALTEEGTGHAVVSNALFAAGSGALRCFDYDLPDGDYRIRDNNLCFASGTFGWVGSQTLAAFQSASSADANSRAGDPGFASAMAPFDFTPASGSPLIDNGHADESAPKDINGMTRTMPDIGAIER